MQTFCCLADFPIVKLIMVSYNEHLLESQKFQAAKDSVGSVRFNSHI